MDNSKVPFNCLHTYRMATYRIDETDQTRPYLGGGVLDDGVVMHMRYVLPEIACDHAILQMRYRESNVFIAMSHSQGNVKSTTCSILAEF